MAKRVIPGVGKYGGPAGGWGALQATALALKGQMAIGREMNAMRRMNQPHGFDCPGCAWPDPKHTSSFEFCENGAKAVSWEATGKRAGPDHFAAHTVTEFWGWSDYELENAGRLTHPMKYDAASDRYLAISWENAFAEIGAALRALPDPNSVEFYTSGRASNEAAFLYQLFAREFGTNNFPDCSNMCHEATSVGLPMSIGVGKGTVTLEDFDYADAIFSFGHNPGTNHPRMLTTLREVSKRGGRLVVFNPLRERGLERFMAPQSPLEMITFSSTPLATTYFQPKIGGDVAVLKGMMKRLLELDETARANGEPPVVDHAFIAEHTEGFADLVEDLNATAWDAIEETSGLRRAEIEEAAAIYAAAKAVIVCYGMGITQHRHGTANVHQIANLLLMGGHMGRPGAGVAPIRGHSNVQGDRTVGITEVPSKEFLDRLGSVFGFEPPREKGHGAVEAVQAMIEGKAKALICLGGNLAVAMPDPGATYPAMRSLDLSVHIATKPNRSHLLVAKASYVLPCLGRTELDVQETGRQSVTVEDSMSVVHASSGTLKPASEFLKSEPAIVAGLAKATMPTSTTDWAGLVADYSLIREKIEAVFPIFADFNARVAVPGGFKLPVDASQRIWATPNGKANFIAMKGIDEDPTTGAADELILTTIRSHDQYNTTIYGLNDRYRGIKGRRDVVFLNSADLAERGLTEGDLVDVEAIVEPGELGAARTLRGLTAVAHDISRGSVAAYYPEANVLVALEHYDSRSGTPSYKSVPVRISASMSGTGTST